MLGGGLVRFVFHLEHNGNIFRSIIVIAEDEVSFGAVSNLVIFFEIGIGKERAHAVELRAAVDLQGLAHHLGGEA